MSLAPGESQLRLTGAHQVVRGVGLLLLTGCAFMFIVGLTVWADQLHGPAYLRYWSWCFLLALIAMFAAGVDMWLIRRAARQPRRQAFREQFGSRN